MQTLGPEAKLPRLFRPLSYLDLACLARPHGLAAYPFARPSAHWPLAGLASRARVRRSGITMSTLFAFCDLWDFSRRRLGSSPAEKPALSLSEGPALSLSKGHKVEEVEGPLFRPPFHFGDALGWLVPSKPTERARRRRCARCLMSKQPQSQLSPALNL